jgi:hypothetical protein
MKAALCDSLVVVKAFNTSTNILPWPIISHNSSRNLPSELQASTQLIEYHTNYNITKTCYYSLQLIHNCLYNTGRWRLPVWLDQLIKVRSVHKQFLSVVVTRCWYHLNHWCDVFESGCVLISVECIIISYQIRHLCIMPCTRDSCCGASLNVVVCAVM